MTLFRGAGAETRITVNTLINALVVQLGGRCLADQVAHEERVFLAQWVVSATSLGEPFTGAHGKVPDSSRDARDLREDIFVA